jgi:hypothetical protein
LYILCLWTFSAGQTKNIIHHCLIGPQCIEIVQLWGEILSSIMEYYEYILLLKGLLVLVYKAETICRQYQIILTIWMYSCVMAWDDILSTIMECKSIRKTFSAETKFL